MTPATNIGVFYDLPSGQVKYIMNPDFEEEIDNHVLGKEEALIKVPKKGYAWGFTPKPVIEMVTPTDELGVPTGKSPTPVIVGYTSIMSLDAVQKVISDFNVGLISDPSILN